MRELVFNISGQKLEKNENCNFDDIVMNSNSYLKLLFDFDASWRGSRKAIKFLNNAMYVVLNKIRGLNTTELFKSWLQSNPITVYYQLSTPTEEDIPTELLTQLKQLQTYSGETNISFEASDVYPTIDLEYIKDTKKYIESKEELDNQSIIDIDYRVTCLELDMEEQ